MCDAGIRMWQLSTRAYAERSRDLSFEISESDDELDNLSAALLREGAAGGVEPGVAAELALIARFYERLGDHAVNLARRSAAMGAPRRMSSIRSLRRRRGDSPDGSSWTSLAGRFRRLRVLPGDSEFFELFSEAASIAHQGAEAMLDMVSSVDAIDEQYQHIRSLERQGDEVAVQVARRLDATFITPYDREDIHALAEELDDVIDEIFAAAALIQAVRVESFLPEVKQQAETLAKMGAELRALIAGLQTREGVKHRLERIEELEREGDAIHRRCMTSLFSGAFDALDVIKWKDIVQAMENAMNKVEDVSDVVEAILVKQS
jgi:predicted phosphate transport protein (TIGR00153 family)